MTRGSTLLLLHFANENGQLCGCVCLLLELVGFVGSLNYKSDKSPASVIHLALGVGSRG